MEAEGQALARFAANVTWDELPSELRSKLIDHLVDTVGVMYCGVPLPVCVNARRAVPLWGAGDEAQVIGTTLRLPAPNAAFLNALHARVRTFDDTYEPGTLHTGSPVIAASLALAEKHDIGGKEFLAALIAGYEVSCRVAAAVSPMHYASGFHNTGTCTPFGAAAAAGRLLKLDGPAIAEAFGLAGATAAGFRQFMIDGSMVDTAFHGARGAQSGVMVAQMRAAGVSGPPGMLEGRMGFCQVTTPGAKVDRLVNGLGRDYEFAKVTIKPYPNCRFVHGPTEATVALKKKHAINPADVETITVATFKQSIDVCDRSKIVSSIDAASCHQYALALAMIKDEIALCETGNYEVYDSEALAYMSRIRVVHDPLLEQDFPRCWPHLVTVQMKDGRSYSELSEYPPGRIASTPSSVVDAKFLSQAMPGLGAEKARRALDALRNVEGLKSIRTLIQALSL